MADDMIALSLLITTQRYVTLVPVNLRATLTGIIVFSTGSNEIKAICRETLVRENPSDFIKTCAKQWERWPRSLLYISKYPRNNIWTNFVEKWYDRWN